MHPEGEPATPQKWLDAAVAGAVELKNLVRSPYEVKKLAACRGLIQDAFDRLQRVYAVLEQLQEQTLPNNEYASPAFQEALADLALVALSFREFVKRFSEEQFLCQLIRIRKLVERVQHAHDGVNDFVSSVQGSSFGDAFDQLAAGSSADLLAECYDQAYWHDQLRSARLALQEDIADRGPEIFHPQDGSPLEDAREKAARTWLFETQRSRRLGTVHPFEDIVMSEISALLDSTILEPWFIPSDDITIEKNKKPLGAGGYGIVYLGMRGSTSQVAVKRILDFNKDEPVKREVVWKVAVQIQALRQEIQIWYQLSHPHILQFYGATPFGLDCSIVSEFAENGNLKRFLQNPEQNRVHLWRLLFEASLGLQYMHEKKIVHGDLRCDNILVGDDMKAKIAEFGLSFNEDDSEKPPCTTAFQWLPPECFDKEPKRPRTRATDVFSFGVCIVEALIGGSPWGSTVVTPGQVRNFFRTKGKLPLAVDILAPRVKALVKDMCAHDPAARILIGDVVARLKELDEANNPDLLVGDSDLKQT